MGSLYIVQALVDKDVVFETEWFGERSGEALAAWTFGFRREHPEVTMTRIVLAAARPVAAQVTCWMIPPEEMEDNA